MVFAVARPLSLVAKILLLVTLVAVLAACGSSPGRHAIPGDNDPHPGVNRALALPIQGLDVARYQGRIDFDRARAGGTHFVYMKSTEGKDYFDPNFRDNWRRAR